MTLKYVWLDVDPRNASQGHDDATALMMACQLENIKLLGVSSVHGNASADCTAKNTARCLHAFAASSDVLVYRGASKPLLRPTKHDPEIHGEDGLGGVVGLPSADSPEVQARFARNDDGSFIHAIEGMATSIKDVWHNGTGRQVSVVSSGPMTNIALFISVYPDLLEAVEQFVFMGGGVGLGNRSAVAEFNIMCDPEAAQIVLDAPVKTVMIPINVTHTAIVTPVIHSRLRSPHLPLLEWRTLSSLISFFAGTYKSTFGFDQGPPLHDALTIAYVSHPELFQVQRYRVDVELHGKHTAGETVIDIWNYRICDDSWGSTGKNCLVVQGGSGVAQFFELLLDCVSRCDGVSPLNVHRI
ncbi:Inosine/uridine-preferring nucleoside hydrolase domain-containing protein [Suillus paluster]|uniref:Inosine/uridine-preferring nucleoside hydrolase domain-containing protein n=1 Tax=Suillus paluster TaxID=48578 RepID=UPI001B87A1A4|nr:Inosine/uridine-preferring nucleoside hydrolase domain-containing protein [Suillus paluster]KAG1735708.1 Inosine/uridine-preferring nucleoside hydrolase domain-containing protein [Suillus paluster]